MFVAQSAAATTLPQPVIVGSAAYDAATGVIPAHAVGDMIVIAAARANATQATKPTASGTTPAYVDIDQAATQANLRSIRTAQFVATATNHTTGTWTNATSLIVVVLRGQHSTPIGGHAINNQASGSSAYNSPAITLTQNDGTSVILTFHYLGTSRTFSATTPLDYTRVTASPGLRMCCNTKDITTSDGASGQVDTSGSTAVQGASAAIEIRQH